MHIVLSRSDALTRGCVGEDTRRAAALEGSATPLGVAHVSRPECVASSAGPVAPLVSDEVGLVDRAAARVESALCDSNKWHVAG